MDRRELGKKPISEQLPTGREVRSDTEFEQLAREIEKMSSPTLSGNLDWQRILRLSEEILEKKSKDLLVLAYFSVALLKTAGLRGFADSVHVIREALASFWDDMFPPKKRMRGRKNAIEWWQDQVSGQLPSLRAEKWPQADRDVFMDDLHAIDAFLGENMEDAPLLLAMINNIGELVTAEAPAAPGPADPGIPVPDTPAPAPAAPIPAGGAAKAGETAAAAAPATSPDQTGGREQDAEKLLQQGLAAVGRAATLLAGQEPLAPLAFRLNRIAAWTSVESLPPATAGKTLIPAPDRQIVDVLEGLYQARNWRELIAAAESRIRQYLFWLDLNRYVVFALDESGRPDTSAVVKAETYHYLQRLPGLETLAFENGMPFADEETRRWLGSLGGEKSSAAAGDAGGDVRRVVENQIEAALKANRENRLAAALGSFLEKLNHAPSARERFVWQLGLCRLLLLVKQTRLAGPHLRELLQTLDTYRVDTWEPELAVEALAAVYTGLSSQEGQREAALLETVLNRITTLDPVKAMEFFTTARG